MLDIVLCNPFVEATGLTLDFHIPAYPLRHLVHSILCYEGYSGVSDFEMLLPDGCPRLIITLDDGPRFMMVNSGEDKVQSRLPRSWITGLFHQPLIYRSERNASTVSIQFEAHGLAPLFTLSAEEVTNQIVEAELIDKAGISELREQLILCKSFRERIHQIELFFLRRLSQTGYEPGLAASIMESEGFDATTLKSLSTEYRFSQKHIISEFKKSVGITPKKLQIVQKINNAIRLLAEQEDLAPAQVALACGFYDQAHFIKSFKEVTGMTPGSYMKKARAYPHVIQLDEVR